MSSSGWTAALTWSLCSASGDIKEAVVPRTSVTGWWVEQTVYGAEDEPGGLSVLGPGNKPGLSLVLERQ